jgi:signal transduction histidine kinase
VNRLTIRTRLSLMYGGLLLGAGLLLLAVTYLLVSRDLPTSNMMISKAVGGTVSEPDTGFPEGATPGAARQMLTSLADTGRSAALHTLLTQGAIALGIVAVLAGALGWLIAGRLLHPLQRVTETARRIADAPDADRGLHERIALDGPVDEVKELADTFDVMVARLDESFDSQRRFIANASHELRTPLTLNRTLLEVALEPPEVSPELHQLGTTLLAINARHTRLIDGLLLLARSERAVAEHAYVDLADIVEHVLGQLPDPPVDIYPYAKEAPTIGDPVLLEHLVRNLVENGVRHNLSEDGWVRVATGSHEGTAFLEVANSGPVVARYDVPALFEPFRRLGADRLASGGAGLGLSIVRAVVTAHGGTVGAEPRETGGLVVTVTLPAAVS